MIKRLLLFAFLSVGLATGAPLGAADPGAQGERISVSQTQPDDPDDPLKRWFREQDRLLDDILARLARIENLVREIHRLIQAMPERRAPPPAPTAPAQAPASGMFDAPLPLVAGGATLLLLLAWLAMRRRRKATAPVAVAAPVAVPPAPTFEKAAAPPPAAAPRPAAPPPPAPVAATARPAPSAAPAPSTQPMFMQAEEAEKDQAIELAEIMLSMGLGHGAAQTLAEQIRSEPKQALRHWLKLLEIYRLNGQQEEFERSAEELRQHFNVQPEDWLPRAEARRSLEDYPHIAARLTEMWGKPGCLAYLENLLADNRGGARSGFPQSVAEELLLLSGMIKSGGLPG